MLFSKKINIQSSEIIDEIIDWKIKKHDRQITDNGKFVCIRYNTRNDLAWTCYKNGMESQNLEMHFLCFFVKQCPFCC